MQAFQQVLSEQSLSVTDQEYYDNYLAHDDRGSLEAAFRDHGRPLPDPQQMKALLTKKSKLFEALMKDGLIIYPGVEPFAQKAAAKYPIALATGARRLEAEAVLKKSQAAR